MLDLKVYQIKLLRINKIKQLNNNNNNKFRVVNLNLVINKI